MTVGGMNVDNKMESIFRALGDYYRGHKAQTHGHWAHRPYSTLNFFEKS